MDFSTFLLNLALTAAAYLCVPTIIAFRGKKRTAKQIKRIVIINGAIVWLIFAIIRAENNIQGSGASVFLWSAVAYWLLKLNCLKEVDDDSQKAIEETKHSLSNSQNGTETKTNKPWILRPVAWGCTIIMLICLEYASAFIFNVAEYLIDRLNDFSTVVIVIIVVTFGSTFLGILVYSAFVLPGLAVTLSDKIYPSNHAFRYYFVGIYELVGCAFMLMAAMAGNIVGGSMFWFYAENIWLAVASVMLMVTGRDEANQRHKPVYK